MDKREEMVLMIEEFAKSGQSKKDFSAPRESVFIPSTTGSGNRKGGTCGFFQGGNRQRVFPCRRTAGAGLSQRCKAQDESRRPFPVVEADPSVLMFSLGSSHRYYL